MIRKVFDHTMRRSLIQPQFISLVARRHLYATYTKNVESPRFTYFRICCRSDFCTIGTIENNASFVRLGGISSHCLSQRIPALSFSSREGERVAQKRANEKTAECPNKQDVDKPESVDDEKNLSIFKRFKKMYRDYWYVLVPVHVITSLGWFGGFYYLAKSGVDIVALVETLGIGKHIPDTLKDSSAGYLAVSYALYKIATPLRYMVTIGGTTISINYLKQHGYIKPIPPKEKLKELYQEKKENFMEKRQHLTEGIKQKREQFKERREKLIQERREQTEK